jgi:hypothetical protein
VSRLSLCQSAGGSSLTNQSSSDTQFSLRYVVDQHTRPLVELCHIDVEIRFQIADEFPDLLWKSRLVMQDLLQRVEDEFQSLFGGCFGTAVVLQQGIDNLADMPRSGARSNLPSHATATTLGKGSRCSFVLESALEVTSRVLQSYVRVERGLADDR